MASGRTSGVLIRAARAEQSRIEKELESLRQRRNALAGELAELDRQAGELRERERLLAAIVEPDQRSQASTDPSPTPARTLKGRELRRVAGQLLWSAQRDEQIHYREWFERVLAAGYAVGGKNPAATFLTNIRDSPAVARAAGQGYYRIAPVSRRQITEAIAETQAELADVGDVLTRARNDPDLRDRIDTLRDHRQRLTHRLRRLEADADEVAAIMADSSTDAQQHPAAHALKAA
jgi:chromosome segregation ATPase